jgi:hypothetical protein
MPQFGPDVQFFTAGKGILPCFHERRPAAGLVRARPGDSAGEQARTTPPLVLTIANQPGPRARMDDRVEALLKRPEHGENQPVVGRRTEDKQLGLG